MDGLLSFIYPIYSNPINKNEPQKFSQTSEAHIIDVMVF